MLRILLVLTFFFTLLPPLLPKTGTAAAASIDHDISWDEVLHDSSNSMYRTQGIMPGDTVRLRLRSAQSDLTSARVRVWDTRDSSEFYFSMYWDESFDTDPTTYDWWYCDISTGSQPTDLYYFFELNDLTDKDFYVQLFEGNPPIPQGIGTMIDSYDDSHSFKIDVGTWEIPDCTGTYSGTCDSAPVPEPSTFILFGTGLAGAMASRRRLKKR